MDPRHPGAFLRLEESLFRPVNHFARHTDWLHGAFTLYAKYGVVLFALVLLGGWWIARGRRDLSLMTRALWAPVGLLIAIGINQPIGNAVAEPRPYTALHHTLLLVGRTTDFSFPSDHAVMAGAVAVGALLVDRKLGLLAAVLAVLMAFARVYVGAHYPLDVVAGLVVGGVVVGLGYALLRRPGRVLVDLLAKTPLKLALTA